MDLGAIGSRLLGALGVYRDLPLEALGAYAGEGSKILDVQGLRVHYRDEGVSGGGPPVVLLHGTGASLHTWDEWVEVLGRSHRVVRMDLPGFGLTGPNEGHRYGPEDDVAFVGAFLDAAGLERVVLAGNSLGGGIALRYALAHPERVSHLILVDSSGLPHEKIWAFEALTLPVLGRIFRWLTPWRGTRRMLRQVYGDDSKVRPELVTRYHRLFLRRGNREALAARWRFPRPPLGDRLVEIEAPALILWGEQDAWLPIEIGREFKKGIRNSKLIEYPGLGHVPMEEAPERTAADVLAFLAETRSAG